MPDEYSYPYSPPDFLQGQSANQIHGRMLESLPADIDKSQGNIPWDFTRPPALEKAEFVEFELNETVKLIFPHWAYGKWLDYHGEKANCPRKAENHATGKLLVTGTIGTVIPAGFQFATPANLTASVIFEAVKEHTLNGEPTDYGEVTNEIDIRAVDGGLKGNVAADTIKLMVKPMTGISYLSNPKNLTGGVEKESDDDYRKRVLDALRNRTSMTGCNADYVRWGMEVPAVGRVIVDPEWPDPNLPQQFHYTDQFGNEKCAGAVRLVIIDSNNVPANQQILDAVYLHIAGWGERDPERLMPIGAHLTVIAPTAVTVNIYAKILIEPGEDIAVIERRFREGLDKYWSEVWQEAADDITGHSSSVRWVQVGAVLAKTYGVKDYIRLTLNDRVKNIPMTHVEYPVTGEVILDATT